MFNFYTKGTKWCVFELLYKLLCLASFAQDILCKVYTLYIVYSFIIHSLPCSILLRENTTFRLSILLFIDFPCVCSVGLLQMLSEYSDKHLLVHTGTHFYRTYLGVESQAHREYVSSTLVDKARVFSEVNVPVYTPTTHI